MRRLATHPISPIRVLPMTPLQVESKRIGSGQLVCTRIFLCFEPACPLSCLLISLSPTLSLAHSLSVDLQKNINRGVNPFVGAEADEDEDDQDEAKGDEA